VPLDGRLAAAEREDAGLYGHLLEERALDALAAGNYDVESRQTLSVTAGDRALRALADVTLVTTQVAQISEFAIRAEGRDVDTVRAAGVVAATPSGSHGYAADAGGPLLASDTSAVAVVPIAPFRFSRDRWVLAPPVSFTVVRDGPTVNLYVDGRRLGPVSAHEPVALDWGDPFPVATVAGSRPEPTFD
jgi:NAD+ kinase